MRCEEEEEEVRHASTFFLLLHISDRGEVDVVREARNEWWKSFSGILEYTRDLEHSAQLKKNVCRNQNLQKEE